MTDISVTFFTDEEIYKELENLGITDVSPEIFEKMKQDLTDMVSSEISDFDLSHSRVKNYTAPETDNTFFSKSFEVGLRSKTFAAKHFRQSLKSSQIYSSSTDISTNDLLSRTPNLPNIYENYGTDPTDPVNKSNEQFFSEEERVGSSCKLLPSEEEILETSYKSLFNQEERLRASYKSLPQLGAFTQTNQISYLKSSNSKLRKEKLPEVPKWVEDISSEMDSLKINDSPKMESLLGDYRKRLINYKVGNSLRQKITKSVLTSDSDQAASDPLKNEMSLISTVVDGKMKRKILRYKDGKPVITEELVDIPINFSSSYPNSLSTTNSFSSDLSMKSNSSTGSLVALSPESTPRSTLSNASKIHSYKPPRKRKSDPVAMYNYYKKFWDNFKPPGEKSHQKLRWAVRDKMLDYSL